MAYAWPKLIARRSRIRLDQLHLGASRLDPVNNGGDRARDELAGVICGMTLLASRAVATPFVGALAAILALAEVIRPLHGGLVYAALDVQMKSLRHLTGAAPMAYQGLQTAFVQADRRPAGQAEVGA